MTTGMLAAADDLPGQRIPLEHLLKTSITWSEPCPFSAKALQETPIVPYSCPPKIEWFSKSHEIKQKRDRMDVEKEIYARFLDFGQSQAGS